MSLLLTSQSCVCQYPQQLCSLQRHRRSHDIPSVLCRRFNATDVRTLRAAVSTFFDLLALVTRTLEMFGPDGEFAQQ